MLRTLGGVFSQRLQRWIPEPFVIALLLTLLTAICSLAFTDSGPEEVALTTGTGVSGCYLNLACKWS